MPRFTKGTIQLSPTQDIPLLRQILHSVFATKPQLYEFMKLANREKSPQSLHSRLERLVKHTLVRRHDALPGFSHALYSIDQRGIEILTAQGEPYAGRGCGFDCSPTRAQHALELNNIHLAFKRAQVLKDWMPESEICSRNILTSYGFAKDYDAVITLHHKAEEITFALEYERSQKTDSEYQSIAAALSREAHTEFILYLVTTRHLFSKVTNIFRRFKPAVAVGMAYEFRQKLLDTNVALLDNPIPPLTIRELIESKLATRKVAPTTRRARAQRL
jgi:hypothetical protein